MEDITLEKFAALKGRFTEEEKEWVRAVVKATITAFWALHKDAVPRPSACLTRIHAKDVRNPRLRNERNQILVPAEAEALRKAGVPDGGWDDEHFVCICQVTCQVIRF
jgi:hypothetical protein